jgi:L-alanine-DL-glutamate epimerase-like enolase superfamily enzyme
MVYSLPEIAEVSLEFVNPFTTSYQTRTEHRVLVARLADEAAPGGYHYAEASPYYGETMATLRAGAALFLDLHRPDAAEVWERASPRLTRDAPSLCALRDLLVHPMAGWNGAAGAAAIDRLRVACGAPPLPEDQAAVPRHTSVTIGIDEIDVMAKKARDAASFRLLKVKLGRSPDHDRAAIRAVREAAPDARLMVDANAAWSLDVASGMVRLLADLGVEFLEQPLPRNNLSDVGELRRRSPLPIFADEDLRSPRDVANLRDFYDGINVKLMKVGGFGPALECVMRARAAGMKVLVGCMIETAIAQTAAARLAPWADFCDLDASILVRNDPFRGLVIAADGLIDLIDVGTATVAERDDAAVAWEPLFVAQSC